MKKPLILICNLLLLAGTALAQAPVPTSWSCDNLGSLPAGYTLNNTIGGSGQFYTSSNQVCEGAGSLRFDFDLENLIINTASQPGRVVYSILGTGTNPPWQGTFTIQESVDGNSWNDLKTYTNGQIPTSPACNYDSVMPSNPAIRYIRFYYTDKISGYNAVIDDIRIRAANITTQKIQVEQNGTQLANGGYAAPFNGVVSTPTAVPFTALNVGTMATLTIDSIKFTGPAAGEFSVTAPALPASVASSSNIPLTLSFTASTAGTRMASMWIYSDDLTTDSVFEVKLYGVGGNFSTEPTVQAGSMNFNQNKTYRVLGSFTAGSPAPDNFGGYLVVRSINGPVSSIPTDGTNYNVGEYIGNAKVILKTNSIGPFSFGGNGYEANTTYHYAVFAFNGGGSNFVNYNTTSPLTGQNTTPATMANVNEYSGITVTNPTFVADLHSLVNPHSSVFYSNYRQTMISGFEARDTFAVGGNKYFYCSYSRNPVIYNDPFDFTATGTSREHSFPHSWMPTNPADNPEKPEYNDQHNLYPAIQVGVNDVRCNYPFGTVITQFSSEGASKFGTDTAGNRVFEPGDEHKGRAARALFYMALCYNSVSGNSWNFDNPIGDNCNGVYTIPVGQDQNILKEWHYSYPPNNWDMSRNDFLDSLQGNRNPFVDNPDWVCYIDFKTMTYIANPTIPCAINTSGVDKYNTGISFKVFPNPTTEQSTITLWSEEDGDGNLELVDMTGKVIWAQNLNVAEGNNTYTMAPELGAGIYMIRVTTPDGVGIQRWVKQ